MRMLIIALHVLLFGSALAEERNAPSFADGKAFVRSALKTKGVPEHWWCHSVGGLEIRFGSGYRPGTYSDVSMIGGSGAGVTADVTVGPSGSVADYKIINPGSGFTVGDVLTFAAGTVPNGTGFSATVDVLNDIYIGPDKDTGIIKEQKPCN